MRFPTEIWDITRRSPQPLVLQACERITALTINKDEQLWYHCNGILKWYFGPRLLSPTTIEENSKQITLPRISMVGTDEEILEQVQYYAWKLIGFTLDKTGDYPKGTLYLIDLWGSRKSQTGTSDFDVALMISKTQFDWIGARKVPTYLGWAGLEVPDLPSRSRKNRYQRDPVI